MTVLSQQAGWESNSVQIHCVTRRKQTANKTAVINQTSATGRQMAGCTCVCFLFPETAVAVMLVWRQFPRCCLPGHSGHSSLVVHHRGPRKKRNALTAVFIYAQVSVPAYKCTCHVMPLSSLQSAVNLPLCLKAVGMERDKESSGEAEVALTQMHSSHTDSRPTPRLNKKKRVFTFLCIHPSPVR